MGEYCYRLADRQSVKMGTCADMYYLRFEDMADVEPEEGSTFGTRFRLPWPDEDHHLPGDYCDGQAQGGYKECALVGDRIDGKLQFFQPAPKEMRETGPFYRLTAVRWGADRNLYPVVSSYLREDDSQFKCMQKWRDTWSNVLPYIGSTGHKLELKGRLYMYSKLEQTTHAFVFN